MKKTIATLLIPLINMTVLSAAEITVFATGVNPDDTTTYYNNKQGNTPTCWAASGSNVIAHWQDNNAPKISGGAISPEGVAAPQGAEVYTTYRSLYRYYYGGFASQLYRYWLGHHHATSLSGKEPQLTSDGKYVTDTAIGAGGFYESVYTTQESVREVAWTYIDEADVSAEGAYTTMLSRAIYYTLSAGNALVLDIKGSTHAITLWGATFDTETNLMTTAWVTDSSGSSFSNSSDMNKARVTVKDDKLLMDSDYYYGVEVDPDYVNRLTIDNAHFLGISSTDTMNFISSGSIIPEPSAFGLLAGLGALALVASRRRRK